MATRQRRFPRAAPRATPYEGIAPRIHGGREPVTPGALRNRPGRVIRGAVFRKSFVIGSDGRVLLRLRFLVWIGASLVLRSTPELTIYGRYVAPRRLLEEWFAFEYLQLIGTLSDRVGN